MATKTKTTKRTAKRKAPAKRTSAKRSPAKRSQPKGIARAIGWHPFAPKSKVSVFDAFGLPPEGMPPGKPLSKVAVKADSTLEVRVPRKGRYVAVAETDNGVRRVEFTVN